MEFGTFRRIKWEYKVVELVDPKKIIDKSIGTQLNVLGKKGWDLVNVVTSCKGTTKAFLKRRYLGD